ncbi:MCE family protein [Nocardioides daeguensis]|uniref:Mce/MlaD domain-containing protein n=1 Tax=Nocardioides daeguensis TaxID=908359 RepID=A0ABP6VJD6_9ACTN|nr:MCE family protein [Nocardioides daeguensis]MBV6728894.1 MCE family protein [Nocardioides daeguensis]MCR1773415.1 MCE family protein [Nocardioides daeguensis]
MTKKKILIALVAAALVFGAFTWNRDTSSTTVRAYFASAEGLNVKDDVKVLGVKVGSITAIENRPDGVLVTLQVDAGQPIPAEARAAIVSPSLVSGRFVQLEPVYDGGPRLEDGATIARERTAVPVTFDDVKQQLTDLAITLGPDAGKKDGPLAVAIKAIDRSLAAGNADQLRTSIAELRGAATALSEGRSDLFSTIEHLDTFTRNLALNDAAVRGFTTELDDVSTVLADNGTDLTGALTDLGRVLAVTERYFKNHRNRIRTTTSDVNLLAAALADRSNELAGVLHVAPHAIVDLSNTIQDQAITGRATLSALDNVPQLLCGAVLGVGGTAEQCSKVLQPLIDLLGIGSIGGTQ